MRRNCFNLIRAVTLIGVGLAIAVPPAVAQEVESVFLTALEGHGYYIPNGGIAKLEVAALANLYEERPVEIGARLEVGGRPYGERVVRFKETGDLALVGRKDSSGLDRWFIPGFAWRMGCDRDGRTITVNGKRVGKSPVDFVIQMGIVVPPEPGADKKTPMELDVDSVAESRKTRIVCGKYAPLPKP